MRAPAVDDGLVGTGHPLPAVVAVHGVVAAGDGGDARALGQAGAQGLDVAPGRFGRHVAPVGDGVDDDLDALGGDDAGGLQHVPDVSVHPAVGDDPHQVRPPAAGLQLFDEAAQGGIGGEGAVLDGEVDLAEIHRHDAPGPDVGMADLGVAHLPARQAHVGAVGDQRRIGALTHDAVEVGGVGQCGGVVFALFAQAPAIEDAQDDGFGGAHVPAFCRFSRVLPRRGAGRNRACRFFCEKSCLRREYFRTEEDQAR